MTSTHLYIPTQPEIDHEVEQMTTAIADEHQKVVDAGRLTDEMKAYFAGRTARVTRAGQLLAAGAIDYVASVGWTVDSQKQTKHEDPQDPEPPTYTVGKDGCQCWDSRNYAGDCKHTLAVIAYKRILSVKLDTAIVEPMSGLYAIECRTPGIFVIMDRATDIDVCTAYFVSRVNAYRPETSADAAEFARWLVAHPADFYPGGLLERLLRTAPGARITLRCDVWYGPVRTYTLSAYRFDGQAWADLDFTDRFEFNPEGWANTLAATGWALTSRPVKQNGVAYHYLLERAAADQVRYELTGACGATVEREREERAFAMIEASAGGSGLNNPPPIK